MDLCTVKIKSTHSARSRTVQRTFPHVHPKSDTPLGLLKTRNRGHFWRKNSLDRADPYFCAAIGRPKQKSRLFWPNLTILVTFGQKETDRNFAFSEISGQKFLALPKIFGQKWPNPLDGSNLTIPKSEFWPPKCEKIAFYAIFRGKLRRDLSGEISLKPKSYTHRSTWTRRRLAGTSEGRKKPFDSPVENRKMTLFKGSFLREISQKRNFALISLTCKLQVRKWPEKSLKNQWFFITDSCSSKVLVNPDPYSGNFRALAWK